MIMNRFRADISMGLALTRARDEMLQEEEDEQKQIKHS